MALNLLFSHEVTVVVVRLVAEADGESKHMRRRPNRLDSSMAAEELKDARRMIKFAVLASVGM